MSTDTPTTPQARTARPTVDEAGIIRHARRLAQELGEGDPAATLLALAQQNERLSASLHNRDAVLTAYRGELELTADELGCAPAEIRDEIRSLMARLAESLARRDDALRVAGLAQGVVEAAAAYQEARAGDYDDDVCEARAQEVCAQVVNWRANRDA